MKNKNSLFILVLLFAQFGIFSCGVKENIDPSFDTVSLDSQLESKPIEVSLSIDDVEIEEFGAEFGEVAELGTLFQELAGHLANVAINDGVGSEVEIDPIIYYANELDQIEDWGYIGKLGLKKVILNIAHSNDDKLASLEFIDEVNVYVDFKEPEEGQLARKEGEGILVATYVANKHQKLLASDGKSLQLEIQDINWIEILKKERIFTIYPELKVNKVPEAKMTIGGEVGVFVGLKLGM